MIMTNFRNKLVIGVINGLVLIALVIVASSLYEQYSKQEFSLSISIADSLKIISLSIALLLLSSYSWMNILNRWKPNTN